MDISAVNRWSSATVTTPQVTTVSLSDLMSGSDDGAALATSLRALGAMPAKVLESRPGGVHVLDLGGTQVTVKLARQAAVGDTLMIALAASPQTAVTADEVQLSASGSLISSLVAAGADAAEVTAANDAPVVNAPPRNAAELAANLQQTLETSGLFYESHLASWLGGKMKLDDIRREPQARLGDVARTADDAESGSADMPAPLASLVRRQLDTLDQQVVQWRGALWPGQDGEIDIAEERSPQTGTAEQPWTARLKVDMPSLGPVTARLTLTGNNVSISMTAADGTTSVLEAARNELGQALGARGFGAAQISVNRDA